MNRRIVFILVTLGGLLLFFLLNRSTFNKSKELDEVAKIALREVGHKLLLSNNDSISRVLPIIKLKKNKFKLSFEKELPLLPDDIVAIVKESIKNTSLPAYYRIEILQCNTSEVAYSYEMKANKNSNIIACRGRLLPKNCYTIEVAFIIEQQEAFDKSWLLIAFLLLVLIIGLYFFNKKQQIFQNQEKEAIFFTRNEGGIITIGNYYFYPEQAKLILDNTDIKLSKKECEILEILVLKLNQVIKREELVKTVWEDKGVFVGRSLDTYISKLRKKLKGDMKIKLINIHGVGYKLEVND